MRLKNEEIKQERIIIIAEFWRKRWYETNMFGWGRSLAEYSCT